MDPIRSVVEDLQKAADLLAALGKGEISPVKKSDEVVDLHP